MKKYQITPYGSQTPAAECNTLPQAAKTLEALKLESLRSSGECHGHYITFSDERHAPTAEIHDGKIYYTYSGVHYVNRAQIVDTIPAGYEFLHLDVLPGWLFFSKTYPATADAPGVADVVAIQTTPEEAETFTKTVCRYWLRTLADCNRSKRPDRKAAAAIARPLFEKYTAHGTKRAAAAAALARDRVAALVAEEIGKNNRFSAAREQYEQQQEAERRAAYEAQNAADLAQIAETLQKVLDTCGDTVPAVYARIIWSENSALHTISTEHHEHESGAGAPRLPLWALDEIIKGAEINAVIAPGGYDKTKILITYPGGSYEMRYDIESNPEFQEHGILQHIKNHVDACRQYPESIRKNIDFSGYEAIIKMVAAELNHAPAKGPSVCERLAARGTSAKLIKKLAGCVAFKIFKNGAPVPGVFYAYTGGAIKYRSAPDAPQNNITYTPGGKMATIAESMLNGCGVAIFPA